MQSYFKGGKLKSSLVHSQQGQSLVEYGLIMALIAVVAIPSLTFMGQQLSGTMSKLASSINIHTGSVPKAMASGVLPMQSKVASIPTAVAGPMAVNTSTLAADTSVGQPSTVSNSNVSTLAVNAINTAAKTNTTTAQTGSIATLSSTANVLSNSPLTPVKPAVISSPSSSFSSFGTVAPSTNVSRTTTTTSQPVSVPSFGTLGTFSSFSSVQSSQQAVQVNGSMAAEELAAFNAASVGGHKP